MIYNREISKIYHFRKKIKNIYPYIVLLHIKDYNTLIRNSRGTINKDSYDGSNSKIVIDNKNNFPERNIYDQVIHDICTSQWLLININPLYINLIKNTYT